MSEIPEWNNLTGLDYETDMQDYLGFIYRLELDDGRYYIGRKQFWSKRGASWYESDWRNYCSSSNIIRDYLASGEGSLVKRDIIAVFTSKSAIRYGEAKAIIDSGSYFDSVQGLNWSFDGCKGFLRFSETDIEQLENLGGFFR
jgi:hypothetical protein